MNPPVSSRKLESLIARCLENFYRKRLARLETLHLKGVLGRKNPYLFRALGAWPPQK
jgi:hypothetical protein